MKNIEVWPACFCPTVHYLFYGILKLLVLLQMSDCLTVIGMVYFHRYTTSCSSHVGSRYTPHFPLRIGIHTLVPKFNQKESSLTILAKF